MPTECCRGFEEHRDRSLMMLRLRRIHEYNRGGNGADGRLQDRSLQAIRDVTQLQTCLSCTVCWNADPRRCLKAYPKGEVVVVDAPGQLDTRGDGEVEIATAAALRQIVQNCGTGSRVQSLHGIWLKSAVLAAVHPRFAKRVGTRLAGQEPPLCSADPLRKCLGRPLSRLAPNGGIRGERAA